MALPLPARLSPPISLPPAPAPRSPPPRTRVTARPYLGYNAGYLLGALLFLPPAYLVSLLPEIAAATTGLYLGGIPGSRILFPAGAALRVALQVGYLAGAKRVLLPSAAGSYPIFLRRAPPRFSRALWCVVVPGQLAYTSMADPAPPPPAPRSYGATAWQLLLTLCGTLGNLREIMGSQMCAPLALAATQGPHLGVGDPGFHSMLRARAPTQQDRRGCA